MARISVEQLSTGSTVAYASYDSTKWTLGSLIKQYTGARASDKYIGPINVPFARPFDESPAFGTNLVDAISWSSTIDWVFLLENTTTGTTKRISAYVYDRTNDRFNWKGFITFTLNTAATHTNRDFVMTYYTYSAGTVGVTTTSVTGSSTAWQTNRVAVGARIGFGTTDPTAVTTWYVISAIGSDTAITLANGVPASISAGTSYVIEELRPVIVTTNNTATNGGVFIAKGVNWDDFCPNGTTIAASAAGTDNLKAVYWLADAGTVTNTVAAGAVADGQKQTASTAAHWLYVLNGTTSDTVYKYNLRAADSIVSGKMTLTSGTNIIITGTQAVTGTTSTVGNLEIATASHGAGSGVKSLYFATTTRWYRANVNNVQAGSTLWISDCRNEVPPGGTVTAAATSTLSAIEYDSVADRFAVLTSGATGFRSYYTNYPTTSGDQFENFFLLDTKQLDGSTTDARALRTVAYSTTSLQPWMKFVNGIGYLTRTNTATGASSIYAVPLAAHWDYAWSTNQVAITPAISTPGASRFYRVAVTHNSYVGSGPFISPTSEFRVWYRTSGISDNTGSWTLVDSTGDLSAAAAAASIQFRIDFQTLSHTFGVPAQIHNVNVIYEDLTTDSHYQPSATLSSASNKRFAWRFATAFGSTVPALRVRLYDAVTGGLLVDDNTASPTGTFEKSTNDGSTWSAWTNADKGNDTTYLRYTPAALADNTKVRALLTQNTN